MAGFGQGGTEFSNMAGHDSNYLALSGARKPGESLRVCSMLRSWLAPPAILPEWYRRFQQCTGALDFFRRGDERPFPPANFAADYVAASAVICPSQAKPSAG